MASTLSQQRQIADPKTRALLENARLLLRQNRMLEAARSYHEVLQRQPDCFEACWHVGLVLHQLNQPQEALLCLQRAAQLAPNQPKVNLALGAILKRLGRLEEAEACCRRELELDSGNADAHYNLALVLQNLERYEEAAQGYRRALALRPGYVDALVNLAGLERREGHWEVATQCLEEAVRREPQSPEAHWELCTTLLAQGRFAEGWKQYEWRWKLRDFTTPPPRFEQPLWDGRDLQGRRIYLHCEQGYGDIIQFARYATLVARCHGEVILGCPKPLRLLLESVAAVKEVVCSPQELGAFEVQAPLLSLPAILGTTLQNVPAETPYLRAPARATDAAPWVPEAPGLKVGVVWAGDPAHRNDKNRSLRLSYFEPLWRLPGIQWHSLQVGGACGELLAPGCAGHMVDLGCRFGSFGDTAQAISELDLVISVDTAVAHLAGALGKPVWILLPYEAEWRWMIGREDSPWYPTMRLFRQSSPGDWRGLMERVGRELVDQRKAG